MVNLRNHKAWDQVNGTLSVSLNPKTSEEENFLFVVLNGNSGNFCLDYSDEELQTSLAIQRAWSSDTGYYVKILGTESVKIVRWWDGYEEVLPYKKIQENPQRFYQAITKYHPKSSEGIVSFAKEAFIKLRNCLKETDNGKISLRIFMYLLAALEENAEVPQNVNALKWNLQPFEADLISSYDWEWLYKAFERGANNIPPLVKLVLRHASNRLFQEAHREATRQDFQYTLWGGADRNYNSGVSEGAFYTPTPLVRTIVQESLWALNKTKSLQERAEIRILDPACGSAEFLREALRQLKIFNYHGKIVAHGWDISETACEMSSFILNYENSTEWNSSIEVNISNRDSLEYNWKEEQPYDLILMNPPFRAFENLGDKKQIVLQELNGLFKRQPDLTAVFWKKASESVASLGAIGTVMPHSILNAETYTRLRNYIREDLGIDFSLVARLGSSGLFEKAMIIPCVLVGTKTERSPAHTVLWTDHQQSSVYSALRHLRIYRGQDIPTPIIQEGFSLYDNELLTKKPEWPVKPYALQKLF